MSLFRETLKTEGKDELATLREAFVYLGLFETSVTNLIDLILMIFIVNHHDFYVYNKRAYAQSLDDLDDASLGEKLTFLNYHKLTIFSHFLDKNLRNKLAHMDFKTNQDGTISIGQQKYNLIIEAAKLMIFTAVVTEVLDFFDVPSILVKIS